MWLFKSKKPMPRKPHKALKRIVAGLVIGGAIGSIIGRKVIEKVKDEHADEDIELEQ